MIESHVSELVLPSPEQLKTLCDRWKIRELSLFGSKARHEAAPDSDVDLLVEYDAMADWSCWTPHGCVWNSPSCLVDRSIWCASVTSPIPTGSPRFGGIAGSSMFLTSATLPQSSICWALPEKSPLSFTDESARTSTVIERFCAHSSGLWNR